MASKITPHYTTVYLTECILSFVLIEYVALPEKRTLTKEQLMWQVKIAQDGVRFIQKLGIDLTEMSQHFDSSLKTKWVIDYGGGKVKDWLRDTNEKAYDNEIKRLF
jgi:hypothetical protein